MRRARDTPTGRLQRLNPERSDNLNLEWSKDLDGEPDNYEERVAGDGDDNDDDYSDDFEDEDEEDGNQCTDDRSTSERTLTTTRLDNGLRVLLPADLAHGPDDLCKIEMLSAERRTELLSEFKHTSDNIVISDAYEVTDPGSDSINSNSRSKLVFPVALPTTRLNHDVLYRFHVMARERNGGWKKVPADYQNLEVTFSLKGVQYFIAYAKPIPESINVNSSGLTFKSTKDNKIRLKIPQGAVDGECSMRIKVYPVNMDRMNAHKALDPEASADIYALTDILYIRHTMDNVLQREGSIRLPVETVDKDLEIKCLSKTSGKYGIVDIDKVQAVRNGQVDIPYKGDEKMSFQVMFVKPSANEDKLRLDAEYLTGRIDSCTILFFLSKKNGDRYLTVEFVDKTAEETILQNRSECGFYEIKNSRVSGVELGEKNSIRVDLGGNMRNAERTNNTQFAFIYNSRCKNNFIEFRTAKHRFSLSYSIVNVLFDGKKVHELHFNYPDVGQNLDDMQTLYVHTIHQRTHTSLFAVSSSNSGYATSKRENSESTSFLSHNQSKSPIPNDHLSSKPSTKTEQELKLESLSEEEQEGESVSDPALGPVYRAKQTELPKPRSPFGKVSPTISEQRPLSATSDISSIPERDHPLLEDASLLILGENLPPEDVIKLMTLADFKLHQINRIRRTATARDIEPNMLLLEAWRRNKKSVIGLSDNSTLRRLEKDLKEIGRADIAKILKRLRQTNTPRALKMKDFLNI